MAQEAKRFRKPSNTETAMELPSESGVVSGLTDAWRSMPDLRSPSIVQQSSAKTPTSTPDFIDSRIANCQLAVFRLLMGIVLYSGGRIAIVTLDSTFGWGDPIYQLAMTVLKLSTASIAATAIWRVQITTIRLAYLATVGLTAGVQFCRYLELDSSSLRPLFRGLDLAVILGLAFTTYRLVAQIALDKRSKEESFLETLALRNSGKVGDSFLPLLVDGLERLIGVEQVFITETHQDSNDRELVVANSTGPFPATDFQDSMESDSVGLACRQRNLSFTTLPLFAQKPTTRDKSEEQEDRLGSIYLIHNSDFTMSARQRATLRVLGGRAAAELERRKLDAINNALEVQMRQVQKLESLGVMAGGIAHDFNNILTAIRSNADILIESVDANGDDFARLAGIQLAVERGRRLCDSLLAYSGGSVTNKCLVDVNSLMEQLATVVHASCPEKKFELKLCRDSTVVWGDEGQLSQVFLNLMKNAQEASEGPNVRLTLTTGTERETPTRHTPHSKSQKFVFVEVRDQGHGIDANKLSKVFDPFFSTKGAGRGLGLSAVVGILQNHGGDIKVHSRPGIGTNFRVSLPLTSKQARKRTRERRGTQPLDRYSSQVCLLVDDDELVRATLSAQLAQLGIDVTSVESGDEAIKTFEHRGDVFDVVIVDQTMPGLSGVDTIHRLRERGLTSKVVLTSGYSNQHGIEDLPENLGFLPKPYTKADLLDALSPD